MGTFYENPTVTKLTPEQAKLKLLGHTSSGDQGAKDCLEEMFFESDTTNGMSCTFLERLYCLKDDRS